MKTNFNYDKMDLAKGERRMNNENISTLANLTVGTEAKVKNIIGETAVTRRLMEMGVVPGVSVRVVKTAPFGCPLEIRVRGYNLAIRRSEAQAIEIQNPAS
ncbi:MAG TPA: FeoA domain-containing protein [Pyrinomonadaceae bacterium]